MIDPPSESRTQREKAARQAMFYWLDHNPHATGAEILEAWFQLRQQWNVLHLPGKYYP